MQYLIVVWKLSAIDNKDIGKYRQANYLISEICSVFHSIVGGLTLQLNCYFFYQYIFRGPLVKWLDRLAYGAESEIGPEVFHPTTGKLSLLTLQ